MVVRQGDPAAVIGPLKNWIGRRCWSAMWATPATSVPGAVLPTAPPAEVARGRRCGRARRRRLDQGRICSPHHPPKIHRHLDRFLVPAPLPAQTHIRRPRTRPWAWIWTISTPFWTARYRPDGPDRHPVFQRRVGRSQKAAAPIYLPPSGHYEATATSPRPTTSPT
jgi:hypothetical protein